MDSLSESSISVCLWSVCTRVHTGACTHTNTRAPTYMRTDSPQQPYKMPADRHHGVEDHPDIKSSARLWVSEQLSLTSDPGHLTSDPYYSVTYMCVCSPAHVSQQVRPHTNMHLHWSLTLHAGTWRKGDLNLVSSFRREHRPRGESITKFPTWSRGAPWITC